MCYQCEKELYKLEKQIERRILEKIEAEKKQKEKKKV